MNMTKLHKVTELGQSIWLDYIDRSLIQSGDLKRLINIGVRGLTSNPAIFDTAISKSAEYESQIRAQTLASKSPVEIYEALVIDDIQMAADILQPIYARTNGLDGYVSLEINPHLARDRQASIHEAKRLFGIVDRPNVMIKIPATADGILAMHELLIDGVNVNATLIFSLAQYDMVANAYLSAMEEQSTSAYDLQPIVSVASFFVSRIDTLVDKLLDDMGTAEALALKGKIGIANAKMAYQHFRQLFRGQRWEFLADKRAQVQRVLFGSTSTKNPDYSDVMYVENLIGQHTVNTLPPVTIAAFMDHGTPGLTLNDGLAESRAQLNQLQQLGIDLDRVTARLLDEGIEKFVRPYDNIIKTISAKQAEYITA